MFFQQEYCENFCEGSLTALLVPLLLLWCCVLRLLSGWRECHCMLGCPTTALLLWWAGVAGGLQTTQLRPPTVAVTFYCSYITAQLYR